MGEKADLSMSDPDQDAKAPLPKRTWHAPQFMMTEIAATDHQNSVVTDNAPTVAQS